jgi:hypothetical protein
MFAVSELHPMANAIPGARDRAKAAAISLSRIPYSLYQSVGTKEYSAKHPKAASTQRKAYPKTRVKIVSTCLV